MNRKKLTINQERFLLILVENKKEMNPEEIEKRAESMGLSIPEGPYLIAVAEPEYGDDFQSKDELIQKIQKSLNHLLFVSGVKAYALANSCENFWLIICYDENVDDVLADIRADLYEEYGLSFWIGIGRKVEQLQKLNVSAVEAQEVLRYRNSFKNDGVINISDVSHFTYRSRIGSTQSYQKVINSFIIGNTARMETELNALVEEIRYTPKVSKSSIRRVMIELTVNILNIASNMNVDVDTILNGTDPYTWIISQSHTEVITAWFMELCRKLISSISELRQKNEIGIVQQTCRYIDENLSDCTLGLASTSEYVGLTSPYLSQLFKKETGVGINSYITVRRMEKAKNLLKNTMMKMDEIALDTGFNSTSYFNQVFKKETGMTPTQYRKS